MGCSKEEIPTKKQTITPTCYTIVMVGDYPNYDFIIVDVNGERVSYKVNDYRDYIGKHQICDLSNLTKL